MKYVVSDGATLSFPDGTKFELKQGIHNGSDFPAHVKKHWAFEAYARPLDDSDLEKEKNTEGLSSRLAELEKENTDLKAKVTEHEKTIADQVTEITDLKAKVAPEGGNSADTDKTDITGGKGEKNDKKQQAAN
ncbi:hypothetical protein GTGU_01776 [Trabulsiella guamensis ATCC 49490]|uniref:Uncharacterized protein n=1 Tax=Trabulsiella guamensis ATCC 49490 TaxID=1005994 RepID=A0A085ABD8_9ENTR|nr:hypothetical protein [Trabulsiella guamensis]KFC07533.1 hypothetical protein GTGU_01776 [Trabulsiella guamensis ATCC 49490]